MVGGRDARGNDTVVKKHLGKTIYMFTQIYTELLLVQFESLKVFQDDTAPNPTLPEHVPSLRLNQSNELGEPSEEVLSRSGSDSHLLVTCLGFGRRSSNRIHVRSTQVSKTAETGEALGRGRL